MYMTYVSFVFWKKLVVPAPLLETCVWSDNNVGSSVGTIARRLRHYVLVRLVSNFYFAIPTSLLTFTEN
jgi:hypothetical protein